VHELRLRRGPGRGGADPGDQADRRPGDHGGAARRQRSARALCSGPGKPGAGGDPERNGLSLERPPFELQDGAARLVAGPASASARRPMFPWRFGRRARDISGRPFPQAAGNTRPRSQNAAAVDVVARLAGVAGRAPGSARRPRGNRFSRASSITSARRRPHGRWRRRCRRPGGAGPAVGQHPLAGGGDVMTLHQAGAGGWTRRSWRRAVPSGAGPPRWSRQSGSTA
jgi:hypothetical protein